MKFVVVVDVVVIGFGAHKDIAPEVVAEVAAEVQQQMVVIYIGAAAAGRVTGSELAIKNKGFATHAGHQIRAHFFRKRWRVHGIYVVKHRTEVLVVVVRSLAISERPFHVNSEMIVQNILNAGARVDASVFTRRQKVYGGCAVPGGEERAASDREVELLSRGQCGDQENRTSGDEERELLQ